MTNHTNTTIDLTPYINAEQDTVKTIVSTTTIQEETQTTGLLALQRRTSQPNPQTIPFYQLVIDEFAQNTRNTTSQIQYLDAFEKAVAVFRSTALELRKTMGVLSLEQRLASLEQGIQPTAAEQQTSQTKLGAASQASSISQKPIATDTTLNQDLKTQINDAIFFSNRYALCFAGYVGLGLLGTDHAPVENFFSFGTTYDKSKDRDDLTSRLARMAMQDMLRINQEQEKIPQESNDPQSLQTKSDTILKEILQSSFTSWINQFRIDTFKDIVQQYGLTNLVLQYDHYSMKSGIGKKKHDLVIVDDKFMNERKEDVIGTQELGQRLWSNCLKLAAYDHDRKKNPYDPASVIFTYGEPGGGKTFTAHAYIQSFAELCREKGISVWALTHSTTDYASHFQNKTANELSALAGKIKEFPGVVIMYVADADNIFQSRKNPSLTSEQQQQLGVYFKMFDGTMIPKNGKFMAVMDANYLEGIDDATKSRLFDEVVEVKRFSTVSDFSELARRSLTRGLTTTGVIDTEWEKIGEYLLQCPLSNREIQHVIKQLRRGFDVPQEMLGKSYDEHIQFRNTQLQGLDKSTIVGKFEGYIKQRMEVERASYESHRRDDRDRFVSYLILQNPAESTGQ